MSWSEAIFERWSEAVKLRVMGGAFVLFVASTIASCNEVRYAVFGSKIQAKLESVETVIRTNTSGQNAKQLEVRYSFTDKDGTARKEEDYVPATWPRPVGPTVEIQYLSGSPDRSRLVGHNHWALTIPFFICGAAFVGATIIWYLGFIDHQRRVEASRN